MTTVTPSAPARLTSALSAEVRKARSFPAIGRTLLLGFVGLLAAAAFAMVQTAQFAAQGREEELGGLTATDLPLLLLHFGQVVPILLGAWVVGQDVPTGPRRTALLATARRGRLFAVKLVTAALAGLVAGLLSSVAALLPLMVSGGTAPGETVSLVPYAWLIGYWTLIAVVTAALVAAARSIVVAVVPILVWTLGLSDLLSAQIPALSGALDQVFKAAYLQDGLAPPGADLVVAAVQVAAAVAAGAVLLIRRDAQ